jgi:hypothetical protein
VLYAVVRRKKILSAQNQLSGHFLAKAMQARLVPRREKGDAKESQKQIDSSLDNYWRLFTTGFTT